MYNRATLNLGKTYNQGFILVATLWILAILTIGAGYLAQWTDDALKHARQQHTDLNSWLDIQDTLAVLRYLLGTYPLTEAGLMLPNPDAPFIAPTKRRNPFQRADSTGPAVKVDGNVYHGIGNALFSLQDEGGLIPANTHRLFLLKNWLGLKGIPVNQRDPLIARLEDYTDHDDLYRLNGAEKQQYIKSGEPSPPNRPLLTAGELAAVLGWKDQPNLWDPPSTRRMVNTVWNAMPNLNTAPKIVLQSWHIFNSSEIDNIVTLRQIKPLLYVSDVRRLVGRKPALGPLDQRFIPSRYIRITLWSEHGPRAREIHLKLTPLVDKDKPWLIDYELNFPISQLEHYTQPDKAISPLFDRNFMETNSASSRQLF